MPMTARFYLTVIDRDYEGDAILDLDFGGWIERSVRHFDGPPPYAIRILERPAEK